MLAYFGGKGKKELGGWLFNNFDLSGINNYVEPFSGMFGIYTGDFSDFSKVKNIVYNDIDTQNCNVFRCSQIPSRFLEEIHNSFQEGGLFHYEQGSNYEEIFNKYEEIYNKYHDGEKKISDIHSGRRNYRSALIYSFLRSTSFKQFHYLTIKMKPDLIDEHWYKRYKFLQPLVNKLGNINLIDKIANITEITSLDFELVMNKYNSIDSFMYLDPPYVEREKYYDANNKDVFGFKDHERIARVVNKSKARIAISYYYFDEIYNLYPKEKYKYISKTVRNNAAGKDSDEVLILNY